MAFRDPGSSPLILHGLSDTDRSFNFNIHARLNQEFINSQYLIISSLLSVYHRKSEMRSAVYALKRESYGTELLCNKMTIVSCTFYRKFYSEKQKKEF